MTERFSLSSTMCQAPCKAQAVWGNRPLVLTPAGAGPSWVPGTGSHWLSGCAGEQAQFCGWGDRGAESPPVASAQPHLRVRAFIHSARPSRAGALPRLGQGRPSSPLHQLYSSPAFCCILPLLRSFQNGSSTPLPTSATYKRHRKPSPAGPANVCRP